MTFTENELFFLEKIFREIKSAREYQHQPNRRECDIDLTVPEVVLIPSIYKKIREALTDKDAHEFVILEAEINGLIDAMRPKINRWHKLRERMNGTGKRSEGKTKPRS